MIEAWFRLSESTSRPSSSLTWGPCGEAITRSSFHRPSSRIFCSSASSSRFKWSYMIASLCRSVEGELDGDILPTGHRASREQRGLEGPLSYRFDGRRVQRRNGLDDSSVDNPSVLADQRRNNHCAVNSILSSAIRVRRRNSCHGDRDLIDPRVRAIGGEKRVKRLRGTKLGGRGGRRGGRGVRP